jgi:hypothetical protein
MVGWARRNISLIKKKYADNFGVLSHNWLEPPPMHGYSASLALALLIFF